MVNLISNIVALIRFGKSLFKIIEKSKEMSPVTPGRLICEFNAVDDNLNRD